jgi:DNA-binding response OmpR family regulator
MTTRSGNILIVDDEATSAIVRAVCRRLEDEGWGTQVVSKEEHGSADDMLWAALEAIEDRRPDGVILDVRLGDYRDDQFKGLDILKRIVGQHPHLPVLMFTQYSQGVERDTVARSALQVNAPVEFIDKLASPEEVALRMRRLVGAVPRSISIGDRIVIDSDAESVLVRGDDGQLAEVHDVGGRRFQILRELAESWYRSPGNLVSFDRLERYLEGDDTRASLRVRIHEIKVAVGRALGMPLRANDFIVSVRDRGYRLLPPRE